MGVAVAAINVEVDCRHQVNWMRLLVNTRNQVTPSMFTSHTVSCRPPEKAMWSPVPLCEQLAGFQTKMSVVSLNVSGGGMSSYILPAPVKLSAVDDPHPVAIQIG